MDDRRRTTARAGASAAPGSRPWVEASITARPFFGAKGFATLAAQVVTGRGVEFVNHCMGRSLAGP